MDEKNTLSEKFKIAKNLDEPYWREIITKV